MEKIEFEKLLLKTAFCFLASDGEIDKREVELIKGVFSEIDQFRDTNFDQKINSFIKLYNEKGKDFFTFYFDLLDESQLSDEEELSLIDIAIKTINADEKIEYSEIKFFKVIRHHLKVSDEIILSQFPDIYFFLEEDLDTETVLDKLKNQYLDSIDLPKFSLLDINN
jgi:uncharacterized tellurite resistance protein B-like protein